MAEVDYFLGVVNEAEGHADQARRHFEQSAAVTATAGRRRDALLPGAGRPETGPRRQGGAALRRADPPWATTAPRGGRIGLLRQVRLAAIPGGAEGQRLLARGTGTLGQGPARRSTEAVRGSPAIARRPSRRAGHARAPDYGLPTAHSQPALVATYNVPLATTGEAYTLPPRVMWREDLQLLAGRQHPQALRGGHVDFAVGHQRRSPHFALRVVDPVAACPSRRPGSAAARPRRRCRAARRPPRRSKACDPGPGRSRPCRWR